MSRKLALMPYAQACVTFDEDGVTLISYVTPVCRLTYDGWLTVYGLYSATTRRHIGAFMKEYCDSTYQTAKGCYNGGYRFNIFTGEIVELTE